MKWLRRRRKHTEESRVAIEKQERLGKVIEWQAAEAREMSEWARDRLRRNHLTDLFLTTRGGRP